MDLNLTVKQQVEKAMIKQETKEFNGDPYANSYYGSGGGSGTGSGWGLNGRSISSRGKEVQKYEFGTVVVQITVNRNGNVIAAKYTKGTTNTNLFSRTCFGNSQKIQMATDPMRLKQKRLHYCQLQIRRIK
jgi:hypothetical protein